MQREHTIVKSRGSIMPMATIALLALLGLSALAIDTGLVYWDKIRLQNAIDAAALSAAKVLDETGNTADATAAGIETYNQDANGPGNHTLASSGLVPTFQYSATVNPFVPGAANGPYVRAIGNNLVRKTFLASIFGIDVINVDATAVAGPSPRLGRVCDVVPVMVCADPSNNNPPNTILGYNVGQVYDLKLAATNEDADITPGNFHLIRLGSPGGANIRENFAGLYEQCVDIGDTVDTEPGNSIGPTAQGTDTRFEQCRSPLQCDLDGDGEDDIRPDKVTQQPMTYDAYKAAYAAAAWDNPDGEAERRIIRVPMADCSPMGSGQTSVKVLDVACFFMTKQVPNGGNQAYLSGEFIGGGCVGEGVPGPNPDSTPGPYKIMLYKDPNGVDS